MGLSFFFINIYRSSSDFLTFLCHPWNNKFLLIELQDLMTNIGAISSLIPEEKNEVHAGTMTHAISAKSLIKKLWKEPSMVSPRSKPCQ